MKKLFIGLILSPLVMFSAAPPPPATQAEVDAGLDSYKYLTPKTFAGSSLAGGPTNGVTRSVVTNVVTDNALLLTQTNSFAAGITNLAKTYSDATTNATGIRAITAQQTNSAQLLIDLAITDRTNATSIRAITAQQTNAPALSNNLYASFVAYPTNSGTDGQVISKTGPHFKFADDASAAGGDAYTNWQYSVYANENVLYDVASIYMRDTGGSGAIQSSDGSSSILIGDGSAGIVYEVSDGDHEFHGLVTITNLNGALSSTSTATTAAENDNSTKIATTAYVQTEIAAFGSGQTNVTDTAAYQSQVNSNLLVKGNLDVYGGLSLNSLTLSNLSGTGVFLAISNNIVVKTNIPAGGAGDAVLSASQTWTGVNTLSNDWKMDAASALYLSNLTTARVLVYNTGNGVTNVGVTGLLLGTGLGAAFSDIQGLAPSVIQTNGSSTSYSNNVSVVAPAFFSPTNANNTGAYTAGLTYFTNLTGNITIAPFAGIPSGSWSITIAAKADGTTRTITFPNGTVNNAVNTAPAVAYVTNGTTLVLQVVGYGSAFTNVLTPH